MFYNIFINGHGTENLVKLTNILQQQISPILCLLCKETSAFTSFFIWDSLSALNLICPAYVRDYTKKVYFIGKLL